MHDKEYIHNLVKFKNQLEHKKDELLDSLDACREYDESKFDVHIVVGNFGESKVNITIPMRADVYSSLISMIDTELEDHMPPGQAKLAYERVAGWVAEYWEGNECLSSIAFGHGPEAKLEAEEYFTQETARLNPHAL